MGRCHYILAKGLFMKSLLSLMICHFEYKMLFKKLKLIDFFVLFIGLRISFYDRFLIMDHF